jgi:hypothetical protein
VLGSSFALALLITACATTSEPRNPPDAVRADFEFELWVYPIPSDVTSVTVNGLPAMVSGQRVLTSLSFSDFQTALGQTVEVDCYTDQALTHVGRTQVGLCATCQGAGCPPVNSLTKETVEFQTGPDFSMDDTTCYICAGDNKTTSFCE